MLDTQRCYICGKYFEDKVKLGLHLSPCYNDAVNIRKEMWHPHPLDLVDEQRYTEYMRGKFAAREKQIQNAERQGVSFVSAENFDAIRSTLGGPPRTSSPQKGGRGAPIPPTAYSPPQSRAREVQFDSAVANEHLPPGGHQGQIAQPVRQVATGVTVLRNELTEELQKIRELRRAEEQNVEERQRVFEHMCSQVGNVRKLRENSSSPPLSRGPPDQWGGPGAAAPPRSPPRYQPPPPAPPSSNYYQYSPSSPPQPSSPQHLRPLPRPEPVARASPVPVPSVSPDEIQPEVMPDGRVRCPWCGKLFGKKGYEVHSKRCSRPKDDFTWSRDADFVKHHPEEKVKADHDNISYGRQFEKDPNAAPAGGNNEAWTQFMVTYPRPILDEKPKTAKEREAAAAAMNAKAEYNRMVQNEMSRPIGTGVGNAGAEEREPTVPCGRCGRYFYASRVAKHEATCVSKPRAPR